RLPLSHWRSHARTAPALQNGRQSVGRACVDPARHRRLRSEFLDARLRWRVVRPRPAAGRKQILHHPVRRDWNRKIGEAIGRPANQISEVQLRRHGRSPIPACDRGARHPSLAPRARQFHGRHADVALGRKASRLYGCAGADGVATHAHGEPQLDVAADDARNDPQRSQMNNGNYTTQPPSLRLASVFFGIATSGGTLAYQKMAPTREQADKLLDERLAAPPPSDANDFLYQWESSRDYDSSAGLERIEAALLA